MKNKHIKYSFVVCSYNREEIAECMLSLISIRNVGVEFIIVDNSENSKMERIIKSHLNDERFRYVCEKRTGLSYARNAGVRVANGEYLIFIDDDALVLSDYIDNLKKGDEHSIVAGKIIPLYRDPKPWWLSKKCLLLLSISDFGEKRRNLSVNEYPIGCNMVIRKKIFEKAGLFNTALGRKGSSLASYEEVDFFDRARSHSNFYYSPEMKVQHILRADRMSHDYFVKRCFADGISKSAVRSHWFSIRKIFTAPLNILAAILLLDSFYYFMFYENIGFVWGVLRG